MGSPCMPGCNTLRRLEKEEKPFMQRSFEFSSGAVLIAGVDEVGRGPLAGPVVTAAVILDPSRPIAGLADSKAMSEKKRERLFDEIKEKALKLGLDLLGGPQGQLVVGSVHGTPGTEPHDAPPTQSCKLAPQLHGCEAEMTEVVVGRELRALDLPGHVVGVGLLEQMGHTRM